MHVYIRHGAFRHCGVTEPSKPIALVPQVLLAPQLLLFHGFTHHFAKLSAAPRSIILYVSVGALNNVSKHFLAKKQKYPNNDPEEDTKLCNSRMFDPSQHMVFMVRITHFAVFYVLRDPFFVFPRFGH